MRPERFRYAATACTQPVSVDGCRGSRVYEEGGEYREEGALKQLPIGGRIWVGSAGRWLRGAVGRS
eukprot:138740-Chlamydomonas_euryale.AAC.1